MKITSILKTILIALLLFSVAGVTALAYAENDIFTLSDSEMDEVSGDEEIPGDDGDDEPSADDEDEPFILGDVNGDGQVTAGDAAVILRYIVRLEPLTEQQLLAADVNEDGVVTAGDAAAILRCIVKLDTIPPSAPTVTLAPYVEPTPEPLSPNAVKILASASKREGTSYKKLDCSSFVRAVFEDDYSAQVGYSCKSQWFFVNSPNTKWQVFEGKGFEGAQPGDVLFFWCRAEDAAAHVAIMAQNGYMWDSTDLPEIYGVSLRSAYSVLTHTHRDIKSDLVRHAYARYTGTLR